MRQWLLIARSFPVITKLHRSLQIDNRLSCAGCRLENIETVIVSSINMPLVITLSVGQTVSPIEYCSLTCVAVADENIKVLNVHQESPASL